MPRFLHLVPALLLGWAGVVSAEEIVGWENDCSSIDGWYTRIDNPTYGANVEQYEKSVMQVHQMGSETWGKVAFVVKDVDIDATPYLQIKVNKVDKDSAFKVGVAPLDWSVFYLVVPQSSADGIHFGDLKTVTGWTGKKDFNVVLIVEGKGKAFYVDHLKISSEKPEAK